MFEKQISPRPTRQEADRLGLEARDATDRKGDGVILRPLSATSTILISRVHLAVHKPFTWPRLGTDRGRPGDSRVWHLRCILSSGGGA